MIEFIFGALESPGEAHHPYRNMFFFREWPWKSVYRDTPCSFWQIFSKYLVENMVSFKGQKTRARDADHMKATASGLIKLLFPDEELDLDDWELIANFSVELRQRVIDQLGRIDPEFRDIKINHEIIQ